MDEKELKTSTKQRVFIILIAILMVGSIIASYAAIVINGSQGNSTSTETPEVDEAKIAELTEAYEKKAKELGEISHKDFKRFVSHKGDVVKGYNESSANENGVKTNDIEKGTGAEVTDDNYYTYYIGWCADETVFDSTFDDNENPTAFAKILDPSVGMIEGWKAGVKGMKLGGIREITIPGELAYGDKQEICGGYNKPLKFMMMAVVKDDSLKKVADELGEAQMRLQYAYYGLDYDNMSTGAGEE